MTYLNDGRLEKFFSSDNELFCYAYYVDPETGKIYLEYDIIMEIKRIYRYSLKEDKGIWLFIQNGQIQTSTEGIPDDVDVEVAGASKEAAIEFMVQKILEKPKRHKKAKVDTVKLEEELRAALAKFSDKI